MGRSGPSGALVARLNEIEHAEVRGGLCAALYVYEQTGQLPAGSVQAAKVLAIHTRLHAFDVAARATVPSAPEEPSSNPGVDTENQGAQP